MSAAKDSAVESDADPKGKGEKGSVHCTARPHIDPNPPLLELSNRPRPGDDKHVETRTSTRRRR